MDRKRKGKLVGMEQTFKATMHNSAIIWVWVGPHLMGRIVGIWSQVHQTKQTCNSCFFFVQVKLPVPKVVTITAWRRQFDMSRFHVNNCIQLSQWAQIIPNQWLTLKLKCQHNKLKITTPANNHSNIPILPLNPGASGTSSVKRQTLSCLDFVLRIDAPNTMAPSIYSGELPHKQIK